MDGGRRAVPGDCHGGQHGSGPRPFALGEYRCLATESRDVVELLARTAFPLSLAVGTDARMAQAEIVSGNYFHALRVTPHLGRLFGEQDDRAGAATAIVLGHRFWQTRFGGEPSVVGRDVRINGRQAVVVGIAPPRFVGAMQLVNTDLWLPAAAYADLAGSREVEPVPAFGVMGRLGAGVTPAQAEGRLAEIAAAVWASANQTDAPAAMVRPATGFGVPIAAQGPVLTLSAAVYVMMALLMAVACANVAALVLARGAGRTGEIAVRLSLGASRAHIARQLVTESVLLAGAGGVVGSIVAGWLTQALAAQLSTPFEYVTYAIDVRPDGRVLAYSAAAAAIAATLCGVAPIRHAWRVDVLDVLNRSASRSRSARSRRTLHTTVALQFAVSTTLLVAAGGLIRTYLDAASPRAGFNPAGLIAASLDADQIQLDRAAGIRLYDAIVNRLAAIPGVTRLALTRDLPTGRGREVTISPDGSADRSGRSAAAVTIVSAGYFETLGARLLQGRTFGDSDGRRDVAVVDETMARRVWPGEPPVGRTFQVDGEAGAIEVIGVVPDLGGAPADRAVAPAFYRPFPHAYSSRMTIVARVDGDAAAVMRALRAAVHDVNRDLSILDLRTMDERLGVIASQRRIPAAALSAVGLLGLVLSTVGLYGVMAYGVRDRSREIGIRLALGARPADVRRLVLRQGFVVVGVGVALGAAGTALAITVIRSTLFGIRPPDPLTLVTVAGVLLTTALAALYLPARSASRVPPADTLRVE